MASTRGTEMAIVTVIVGERQAGRRARSTGAQGGEVPNRLNACEHPAEPRKKKKKKKKKKKGSAVSAHPMPTPASTTAGSVARGRSAPTANQAWATTKTAAPSANTLGALKGSPRWPAGRLVAVGGEVVGDVEPGQRTDGEGATQGPAAASVRPSGPAVVSPNEFLPFQRPGRPLVRQRARRASE